MPANGACVVEKRSPPPSKSDDWDRSAVPSCKGFLVSGAGSSDVDGCYHYASGCSDVLRSPCLVKDQGFELYRYEGVWRLGMHGFNVSYLAAAPSELPPTHGPDDWQCCNQSDGLLGRKPCPSVTCPAPCHNIIPPTPPPPPPLPPPPPPIVPPPAAPPATLVLEDHFDGQTLNQSVWNVLDQVHVGGVYSPDNVFLRNGSLVLRTVARNQSVDGVPYYAASGAVNTSGLFAQRGGRFEARVKLPDVQQTAGFLLHSSVWLTADTGNVNNSGCDQEIDLAEQYPGNFGGRHPTSPKETVVAGTLHPFTGSSRRGKNGCQPVRNEFGHEVQSNPLFMSSGDFTSEWHVFRVDWNPRGWIAFYVDGQLTASFVNASSVAAFTDPLFIALTACVMGRVPVLPTDVLPQEYLVDYVRVYSFESGPPESWPVTVGTDEHLLIDDSMLQDMQGLSFAVHSPAKTGNMAVVADKPWEKTISSYNSVLTVPAIDPSGAPQPRFRVYYMALAPNGQLLLCVAVSHDTVSWTKPSLGQSSYGRHADTNILGGGDGEKPNLPPITTGGVVFFDTSSSRYLLVMGGQVWFSPDGLSFREGPHVQHIPFSDTQTVAWYDERVSQYRVYFRTHQKRSDGKPCPGGAEAQRSVGMLLTSDIVATDWGPGDRSEQQAVTVFNVDADDGPCMDGEYSNVCCSHLSTRSLTQPLLLSVHEWSCPGCGRLLFVPDVVPSLQLPSRGPLHNRRA